MLRVEEGGVPAELRLDSLFGLEKVRAAFLLPDDPRAGGRLYVESVFVDLAWQVSRFYLEGGGPIVDAAGRSRFPGLGHFLGRGKSIARTECVQQDTFAFDVPI